MPIGTDSTFELLSAVNSSTANLASGATFTGTLESIIQFNAITVTLLSTQNSTLVIDQSSDGANWDISASFSATANAGFATVVGAQAAFCRIRVTNTGGLTSTSFRLSTIFSEAAGALPNSLGQKTSINSLPVVISSDQSSISVAVISTPSPTPEASGFEFGTITTSATTEVLLRKSVYTEQTTNAQRSIVSSSANDTSAGTGIRTVRIIYYTATGTGPFNETITLNGTVAVNTVATDICYIDKLTVLTVGSGGTAAGNITMKAATAGGGATIKQISTGDLQSFDAIHYVATGTTLYITGISSGHNGTTVGSGARYRLRTQQINVANVPLIQTSDFVRLYGQSSTFARTYSSPIIITGPAKVELWIAPETASSTIYYGSFDYFTR